MTQRKARKLPRSRGAEREFRDTHDSSDYFDWSSTSSTRLPILQAPPQTLTQRVRERLHNLLDRFRRRN